MENNVYDSKFYSNRERTFHSAQKIVPIIMNDINPQSVVDVGCGLGEFLGAFVEQGVDKVLGLDGDWVDRDSLRIDPKFFQSVDLKKPIDVDGKYDLVVTCEVAEHLSSEYADLFVDSLISLGDVILFSAAIPQQGGTYHVNEQWPQYWVDKFVEKGYVPIDYLRTQIWNDPDVRFWYKQNLIMFVKKDQLDKYPVLSSKYKEDNIVLSLVHPEIFGYYATNYRRFTSKIPSFAKKALRKIIKL